jgi:hypothetical protein
VGIAAPDRQVPAAIGEGSATVGAGVAMTGLGAGGEPGGDDGEASGRRLPLAGGDDGAGDADVGPHPTSVAASSVARTVGWRRIARRYPASHVRVHAEPAGGVGRTLKRPRPTRAREEEGTMATGSGTREDPWVLRTAPGTSEYTMYRDDAAEPPQLVCQVGSTKLTYQARAIDDLHAWLESQGDWVPLGAADEQKPAADGTVEAFGRAADNPVGGWYGLRKGYRGRFGMYLPPLLEALGLAELTHDPKNNRMRAR